MAAVAPHDRSATRRRGAPGWPSALPAGRSGGGPRDVVVAPATGLLFAVLGLVLAGCGATSGPVRAPVEIPERFTESGEGALPERWWTLFGDAQLTALVERALAGNLELQVAWDRLRQAEAAARKAGADFYPTVDASAGLGYAFSSAGGGLDLGAGLAAGYEVDLWGRVRSTADAAQLDARAARDAVDVAAISVAAQVATLWFQLVEQRAQLELLERQLERNRRVLELVELRFAIGQAGAADLLRQRQVLESARGDRARLEAAVGTLELGLAVLLGRPPGTPVAEPVAVLVEPPPLPATGLPAELLRRRPDVRQAWHVLLAADRRVAAAVADRYPRLSLSARAEVGYDARAEFGIGWLASLAANLLAPLFDGWKREAEVERTEAVASAALHAYGIELLGAFVEVEEALVRIRTQEELLEGLEQQLALARSTVEQARASYARGAVSYLQVLEAVQTEQALERTQLTARRELLLYVVALCRALAGGWTPEPADADGTPATPEAPAPQSEDR